MHLLCLCLVEVDVGKDEEFTVNTRGAGGQGKLDVKITSPSRRPIPCKVESGAANEVHSVKYIPPEEGPYKIDITYDGNPVPGSPFTVEGVMPPDPSKVQKGQCDSVVYESSSSAVVVMVTANRFGWRIFVA